MLKNRPVCPIQRKTFYFSSQNQNSYEYMIVQILIKEVCSVCGRAIQEIVFQVILFKLYITINSRNV